MAFERIQSIYDKPSLQDYNAILDMAAAHYRKSGVSARKNAIDPKNSTIIDVCNIDPYSEFGNVMYLEDVATTINSRFIFNPLIKVKNPSTAEREIGILIDSLATNACGQAVISGMATAKCADNTTKGMAGAKSGDNYLHNDAPNTPAKIIFIANQTTVQVTGTTGTTWTLKYDNNTCATGTNTTTAAQLQSSLRSALGASDITITDHFIIDWGTFAHDKELTIDNGRVYQWCVCLLGSGGGSTPIIYSGMAILLEDLIQGHTALAEQLTYEDNVGYVPNGTILTVWDRLMENGSISQGTTIRYTIDGNKNFCDGASCTNMQGVLYPIG